MGAGRRVMTFRIGPRLWSLVHQRRACGGVVGLVPGSLDVGGCHDAAVAGVGEFIGRVEAGFLIERLHEPRPTAAAADIDRDDYERLTREPTGLGSHRGWHLATTMNCAFPSCLRRSRAGLSHEALHFLRFRQAPLAPDFKCRYPTCQFGFVSTGTV